MRRFISIAFALFLSSYIAVAVAVPPSPAAEIGVPTALPLPVAEGGTAATTASGARSALGVSSTLVFGIAGLVPSLVTRYLFPGANVASGAEIKIRIARAMTLTSISVVSTIAPGAGLTDVFTVRINGSDTALTVSLADTNVEAHLDAQSVALAAGDQVSVKVVTALISADTDPMITIEGY